MSGSENETGSFDEDEWHRRHEEWIAEEEQHALLFDGIEEQNCGLLQRYHEFCRAADTLTAARQQIHEVVAVSLIGSLAREP